MYLILFSRALPTTIQERERERSLTLKGSAFQIVYAHTSHPSKEMPSLISSDSFSSSSFYYTISILLVPFKFDVSCYSKIWISSAWGPLENLIYFWETFRKVIALSNYQWYSTSILNLFRDWTGIRRSFHFFQVLILSINIHLVALILNAIFFFVTQKNRFLANDLIESWY